MRHRFSSIGLSIEAPSEEARNTLVAYVQQNFPEAYYALRY